MVRSSFTFLFPISLSFFQVKMLGSIAFLALLAASVVEGKRADYALKERHFVPKKWDRVGSAPAEHVLNIQIGLKQGNFEQLEKLLFEGMCSTSK